MNHEIEFFPRYKELVLDFLIARNGEVSVEFFY